MTQASTSTAQFIRQPEHNYTHSNSADVPNSCARIAISTSGDDSTTDHSGHSTGSSVLQKLRGFFSPRKPSLTSSTPANKQRGHLAAPDQRPSLTSAPSIHHDADIAGESTPGRRSGEDFEKVFRYLDQNGDGKISPSELCSYMKAVGEDLSAEDAEAVVESTDSDGDGLLGFDDFVKLVVDVGGGGEEERTRDLVEAFGMYEMKGQGCITPKSLRRTLRRLGEAKTTEECRVMIRRFDLDGDGVLSFDEFKIMML